jgi:hypothetical protein
MPASDRLSPSAFGLKLCLRLILKIRSGAPYKINLPQYLSWGKGHCQGQNCRWRKIVTLRRLRPNFSAVKSRSAFFLPTGSLKLRLLTCGPDWNISFRYLNPANSGQPIRLRLDGYPAGSRQGGQVLARFYVLGPKEASNDVKYCASQGWPSKARAGQNHGGQGPLETSLGEAFLLSILTILSHLIVVF